MKRAISSAANAAAPPPRSHRRPLRIGLLASAGAALGALLLPAVHHPQMRFVWNASASVPLGLYRIEPGAIPRVGDLVAVRPSPALARFMATRRYVEDNVPLLKPVAAVSGATVCRAALRITIDGHHVADALADDRLGRSLPRWSGCQRLTPGFLFLIAPAHPDSFDSRYFGPVSATQVIGRALPLWTWS
jgi:conjugative transfer signal peptidase TraF